MRFLHDVVKQTSSNPGVGKYNLRKEYFELPAGGSKDILFLSISSFIIYSWLIT